MTIRELYEAGYAIPLYGLYTHTFRHFEQEITLPHGSVSMTYVGDEQLPVARWADVLKATRVH